MPRHYFVSDISLDKDRTETLQNTLNSSENTKRILDKHFQCLFGGDKYAMRGSVTVKRLTIKAFIFSQKRSSGIRRPENDPLTSRS
jgi:hypothetical protein